MSLVIWCESLIFFGACTLGSYYGTFLMKQGVFDTLAVLGEEVLWESAGWEVAVFADFFGRVWSSTGDGTEEGEDDFLFLWFGIDAYEASYFDIESCLFTYFADSCLLNSFSYFHASTGEIPPVGVTTVSEEDASFLIEDEGEDCYAEY